MCEGRSDQISGFYLLKSMVPRNIPGGQLIFVGMGHVRFVSLGLFRFVLFRSFFLPLSGLASPVEAGRGVPYPRSRERLGPSRLAFLFLNGSAFPFPPLAPTAKILK